MSSIWVIRCQCWSCQRLTTPSSGTTWSRWCRSDNQRWRGRLSMMASGAASRSQWFTGCWEFLTLKSISGRDTLIPQNGCSFPQTMTLHWHNNVHIVSVTKISRWHLLHESILAGRCWSQRGNRWSSLSSDQLLTKTILKHYFTPCFIHSVRNFVAELFSPVI